ncbi:zinc finger and BTB domain-containing protein 26-like [Anguilla rostrata]|uniref:zinc finger and BTB domain-containing protein 26-like n=1 Tax=Anguilla rostrata TaxID=7938 RepID=UPI0030CF244F
MTPSSDVLQFRFAGHGDTVLEKMNILREDRRFCDVTLILGGFRFPGHRVVLAASSAFLRDQFLLHDTRELQVSVLPSADVGRRLLLCCYTGVLEFPLRELVTYLMAASALQMSHVVEKCERAVSQYLDPTLAQLKLENSPDPYPLKEKEDLNAESLGEHGPEGAEYDLDSEDSVQIIHTEAANMGTLRIKQQDSSSDSPTGSPSHSRAGVADSSQDQEFGGGDVYMLAAQHLQLQGGESPGLGESSRMPRDALAEHDSPLQRIYFCRKCDRVFQQLENYVGHLKEHKLYLCLLCGKSFSQKSNLTRHIRVHTGIKPFQCPLCHKTFSQKATLQDHLNLHTGNKPHKCNYCAMHFAHKPGLRRHLRDIHGKSSLENMFEEV